MTLLKDLTGKVEENGKFSDLVNMLIRQGNRPEIKKEIEYTLDNIYEKYDIETFEKYQHIYKSVLRVLK